MPPIREPEVGDLLNGQYRLTKEIGRGGFGVVFEAVHVHLERVVAIKALLTASMLEDPKAKDRFRREARITASLSYPNALRIHDYGETPEGVLFLVMEYIRGQELTKVIRQQGALPLTRAIPIIRQVLYALGEAHSQGILHRDVKPDNVMLCSLSYTEDFVKVMDFGIAKMSDDPDRLTREGLCLGTPRYMPVEQLRGQPLTPSTDLYAVGLMLYEMVSGRPAYAGKSVMDIVTNIIQQGSFAVPADVILPAALRDIIERATRRSPHERFQNTAEFLRALHALEDSAKPSPLAHAETMLVSHADLPSMPPSLSPPLPNPATSASSDLSARAKLSLDLQILSIVLLVVILVILLLE